MKKIRISLLGIVAFLAFMVFSCSEEPNVDPVQEPQVDEQTLSQFSKLGFDVSDIRFETFNNVVTGESEQVYVLENDIKISPKLLEEMLHNEGNGPKTEQYRTTNQVSSPKTIKVLGYYASGTNSSYLDATMRSALQMAVDNYNNLNLGLTFTLAFGTNSSNYDIVVTRVSGSGGGRAGFPSGGNPYKWVEIQSGTSNYGLNVVEHVMTHEIGHCVGLRHTDYFNRSISCGSGGNEGSAGVGAIHIPGTPSTTNVDMNSIMLACFNGSENGEFSNYDATALTTLYPGSTNPPGDPTLSVSPTSVSFGYTSGSRTITVSANVSWTVTDNASWISVSPSSGSNSGSFTISVAPYNMVCEPSRRGTVTVNGGAAGTKTISVSQSSRPLKPGEQCP
ncbi:peptidase [Fulvivirga sp. 29W222]|uniref:Peptidase n=1 Tax=Fulvivirga marina TaxID=2494733 RepID=A0A937KBS6_9BACT|nr:M57 family metalloprotease [Fulvivirga marina]MBL6447331.1 peptidase [Fulvivirga marina]